MTQVLWAAGFGSDQLTAKDFVQGAGDQDVLSPTSSVPESAISIRWRMVSLRAPKRRSHVRCSACPEEGEFLPDRSILKCEIRVLVSDDDIRAVDDGRAVRRKLRREVLRAVEQRTAWAVSPPPRRGCCSSRGLQHRDHVGRVVGSRGAGVAEL